MSYVFNSKDHLSQMTSVHLYEQMIHSLCCQWALSHRPLTIHVRRQRDVATWGQNAESSPWHPPHSQPLTHYKEDVSLDRDFPAVWRPCGTKSCLALLTRALRGTMRGQTGRPPWKTTLPGWAYWQITISVLPEWLSSIRLTITIQLLLVTVLP